MRASNRIPFAEGGIFLARKSLTFRGQVYEKGDRFDWGKAGCSSRRLHQLWEARYLEAAPSSKFKPVPKAAATGA